jgi:hypothetical protein
LFEKVISQVEFEIGQIDLLLESYADLLKSMERSVPNLVQLTAIASVLHSFCYGVENTFSLLPKKSTWRRQPALKGIAIFYVK